MLLFVDRFLAQKYPRDHFDFAALKWDDITTFVRKQATELGSVQAKHMITALRGFFSPGAGMPLSIACEVRASPFARSRCRLRVAD